MRFLAVFLALSALTFSVSCSRKAPATAYHTQEQPGFSLHSDTRADCPMSSERIYSIQDLFTSSLPETDPILSILLVLSATAASVAIGTHLPVGSYDRHASTVGRALFRDPESFLFDRLKLAFARGILNPKIHPCG